jgi:hypothetical protein
MSFKQPLARCFRKTTDVVDRSLGDPRIEIGDLDPILDQLRIERSGLMISSYKNFVRLQLPCDCFCGFDEVRDSSNERSFGRHAVIRSSSACS